MDQETYDLIMQRCIEGDSIDDVMDYMTEQTL